MAVFKMLKKFLLRPSLWTALISIIAYWDKTALHGTFVYDDQGSVKKNVVVNGMKPWKEAFSRDFWGTEMVEAQSHKSFRPITTLTFRLNWILGEKLGVEGTDDFTYGFHVVNVILHGIVTGMVTDASAFVFNGGAEEDIIAQLITGFIFGLHPVHAESVSNITSRGEMLMSFFFLAAFLSYASCLRKQKEKPTFSSFIGVYVFPWLCMTLSLFSKEQGATTLITVVIYDFVQNHVSVKDYLTKLLNKDKSAVGFLIRTIILAVQTVLVCLWRYWLNGETSPDFIYDQNPAGFSEDRFTRVFSVSWVYCLYIIDALYPNNLSADWSGVSIDLITDISDGRIMGVLMLWCFAAGCVWSLFVGPNGDPKTADIRRVVLMAFLAFLFTPFFLSSNLLVVVGLMKADRVIYLPLVGFCLLEALLFKTICNRKTDRDRYWFGHTFVLIQLMLFTAKLHERNLAWSNSLDLWESAYKINPRSHHTIYNYGYELSLKQRYEEAEKVLRPIRDPRVDSPSNTFVYCMVLYNLNRCDEANELIDDAMDVLDDKKNSDNVRDTPDSIARAESNLLVAKAHCAESIPEKGKLLYDAVQVDPRNEYAHQQAQALMNHVEMLNKIQGQKGAGGGRNLY